MQSCAHFSVRVGVEREDVGDPSRQALALAEGGGVDVVREELRRRPDGSAPVQELPPEARRAELGRVLHRDGAVGDGEIVARVPQPGRVVEDEVPDGL